MSAQIRDAKLAASFFLLASAAILLTRLNGGVALLWIANAPLIGCLCRQDMGDWRSTLLWTMLASIVASLLFGPVAWAALFFGSASIIEAALSAFLLKRWLKSCDYFDSFRSVVVFSVVAGLVAPATGALIGATTALYALHKPWAATFVDWVVGRGLGTLIASPIVLLLLDSGREAWMRRMLSQLKGEGGALLAAVAIVTAGVFWQQRLPLLFLPALPIVLATFKLGRPGAALSMLLVALIGGSATASGHGPVMMTSLSHVGQLQFFQFYLAATFLLSLPIAGTLDARERLMAALADREARHRRIVDRSQDVIFEANGAGRWTFLSQAWVRLTGRAIDESLDRRALALVLPADRPALLAAVAEAYAADGAIGQAEVRFTTRAGIRWAVVSVGALHDSAGCLTGTYGTISDITERKLSQSRIVSSESRYRILADNTTDMIARIGSDRRYSSATPASMWLLGMTPDELVGRSFVDPVAPEHQAEVLGVLDMLFDGTTDQSCSYRQSRIGKDPIWVEAVFRGLRNDDGRVREVIASVRDISERKAVESEAAAAIAQVRETNRLFRMAGSLASIGHWRLDLVAESLTWSDEVYDIHGLTPGTSLSFAKAVDRYHPDDRVRVQMTLNQAVVERRSFEFGARLVRPDASIRHVLVQGQVELDDAGGAIGMFGVVRDITESALAAETLRDSEARLRLITEQARDMITLLDLRGICLFMSPASATILGIAAADIIGTTLIDRVHEDDRPAVQRYRMALRTGLKSAGAPQRFRMARSDDAYVWLEASSRLAVIGETACVVAVWRDVTSQVAIEAELKSAKAEAEAASVAKAGFLANMSHEIRTPMNGVIGFAELLLTSDLSDGQRRDAGLIVESGRTMMKLLNDILDLSKIDAGQLDVVCEPYDLSHALRACGKLLGPSAAQKRLPLTVTIADDVPKFVLGDALRMRQIVLNLLGNAIKFTEHGEVRLGARLIGHDGSDHLLITVSDTGIGIAPERQNSIFEEFVQADHSITRRYGGSGLGLAISNRLARLMGGRIDLTSRPGHGTTVLLELPNVEAEKPAESPRSLPASATRRATRSARVLLADDHEVNQLLVHAMLTQGGHDVTVVSNGQLAVDEVRRSEAEGRRFDLVFMDMQMPVMDGLAATLAIRQSEPETGRRLPIVALTANAFASDLEICRSAGMDDHVAKPVSMEALFLAVDRWCQAGDETAVEGVAPRPGAELSSSVAKRAFQPGAVAQRRYAEHRARTLEHVDAVVRRGTYTDEELQTVAELLHKLAGTAGMFGETLLGDRASEMEEELQARPIADRATLMARAGARLRDAA